MSKKSIILLLVAFVAICAIWALTPLATAITWTGSADTDPAKLGPIGDIFGSTNALFSGLGTLAVAVVLFFDLRERKRDLRHRQEEFRPLVTATCLDGSIEKAGYDTSSSIFDLTIKVNVLVSNHGPHPAVDLKLSSKIQTQSATGVEAVPQLSDTPLGTTTNHDDGRPGTLHFSATGPEALEIFRTFNDTSEPRHLVLTLKYGSLNGIEWQADVKMQLRLLRGADEDSVKRVCIRDSGERIGPVAGQIGANISALEIEFIPERGSWTQGRIGG